MSRFGRKCTYVVIGDGRDEESAAKQVIPAVPSIGGWKQRRPSRPLSVGVGDRHLNSLVFSPPFPPSPLQQIWINNWGGGRELYRVDLFCLKHVQCEFQSGSNAAYRSDILNFKSHGIGNEMGRAVSAIWLVGLSGRGWRHWWRYQCNNGSRLWLENIIFQMIWQHWIGLSGHAERERSISRETRCNISAYLFCGTSSRWRSWDARPAKTDVPTLNLTRYANHRNDSFAIYHCYVCVWMCFNSKTDFRGSGRSVGTRGRRDLEMASPSVGFGNPPPTPGPL